MRVAVVGAGICGLTAAESLLERGHALTIYAAETEEQTTSRIATALLFPYAVPPTAGVKDAARATLEYFRALDGSAPGIRYQQHMHLSSDGAGLEDVMAFGGIYDGFRELAGGEIPGGYAAGWAFNTYFVDSRTFMPHLQARLVAGGARMVEARFSERAQIDDLREDVIVNCTGLGSRALFGDPLLYPVKGQLVYVDGPSVAFSAIHDGYYLLPRHDSCVLGGTKEHGVWDTGTDTGITAEIIRANQRIDPALNAARLVRSVAGLRPCRDGGPRLEVEDAGRKRIVHNYGHGGAGWTLAAGCAQWVASVV